MDKSDDDATAAARFEAPNLIVKQLVTRPNKLAEFYAKLPAGAREQSARQDQASAKPT